MKNTFPVSLNELPALRSRLKHGDPLLDQAEIVELEARLVEQKPSKPSEWEIFPLVDEQGQNTGLTAPRWLCHLLGLRHRSVHVLLQWKSPGLGDVFIFQVRNWQKRDYPGHVDISVGGHVTLSEETQTPIDAAYREMQEELGLGKEDLLGRELVFRAGYAIYGEDESKNFYNAEWCDVYLATLGNQGFQKLHFVDNEVVGIYLCPQAEAKALLEQTIIPIAAGLKFSLPHCL